MYNINRLPPNDADFCLTRCTFSGNSARYGGGVYNTGQNASQNSVVNCTITGNTSELHGGGVYSDDGANTRADFHLVNTIIAGNTAGSDDLGFDLRGNCISDGHNIIGREKDYPGLPSVTGVVNGVNGDQVGTPAAPIDPKLGALQMNGGFTATHSLLAGSTAINSGGDPFAPTRDQRGFFREGASDIGAFEYQGTSIGKVVGIARSGNDLADITVSFEAVYGKFYRLERKLNLTDSWQSIPDVQDLNATGNDVESITAPNSVNLGRAFYRATFVH